MMENSHVVVVVVQITVGAQKVFADVHNGVVGLSNGLVIACACEIEGVYNKESITLACNTGIFV